MTDEIEGWEHVLAATTVLKEAINDLFRLPGAAQERARVAIETLGDDHGDDLTCGCFHASGAATGLLELAGRHADGLVMLADQHAAFALSAMVLARASLESSLRVAWLLEPPGVREREQRWIQFERETQRFYRNVSVLDAEEFTGRMTVLDDLAAEIGGDVVKGTPSAESLAKTQGRTPQVYDFYRWASQPTHGTMIGAGTLDPDARQEWMERGGEGEWVEAEFWGIPITTAWEGLCVALPRYRDLFAPEEALPALDREPEFRAAMRSLPPNFQARPSVEAAERARPRPQQPNREQRRAADRRTRRQR